MSLRTDYLLKGYYLSLKVEKLCSHKEIVVIKPVLERPSAQLNYVGHMVTTSIVASFLVVFTGKSLSLN